MYFDLKTPCKGCPFRTDCRPHWLSRARAFEIAQSIQKRGHTFPCHKTTEHDEDDNFVRTGNEQHCAGALLVLMQDGGLMSNQMLRIAANLRLFQPKFYTPEAPAVPLVFSSFKLFIQHHS
jgi:hypothetical protein